MEKIEEFGLNYEKIIPFFPLRTIPALRSHYSNLTNRKNRGPEASRKSIWTTDEDMILKVKVDQGLDFKDIHPFLPSRSAQAIKNHYDYLKTLL